MPKVWASTRPGLTEHAITHSLRAAIHKHFVVYQGQLVGEWYAQGFSKDSMATSWSVAKSFLSVLYGIAMDQGDLATLDEPVGQWIPEWADDARGAITLRQLLQMQSGLDSSTEDMFSPRIN